MFLLLYLLLQDLESVLKKSEEGLLILSLYQKKEKLSNDMRNSINNSKKLV